MSDPRACGRQPACRCDRLVRAERGLASLAFMPPPPFQRASHAILALLSFALDLCRGRRLLEARERNRLPRECIRAARSALPDSWPYAKTDNAVTARAWMVATDAPIATHVGAAVLRNGGNAVDAAVATAFALAVVLSGRRQIWVAEGSSWCTWATGAKPRSIFARPRRARPRATCTSARTVTRTSGRSPGSSSAGVPGSVAGSVGRAREASDRARGRSSSHRRSRWPSRDSWWTPTSPARSAATARGSSHFPASAALFLPERARAARRGSLARSGSRRRAAPHRGRRPERILRAVAPRELIEAEMRRGQAGSSRGRISRATRRSGAIRSCSLIAGTR